MRILEFEKAQLIKALYICIKAKVFLYLMWISEYVASQFYCYQILIPYLPHLQAVQEM